jgi:hypothetical protein
LVGEEGDDGGREFGSGECGPVVAWHVGEVRIREGRGEG